MSAQLTLAAALAAGGAAALGVIALAAGEGPTAATRLLSGVPRAGTRPSLRLPPPPPWLALRLARAGRPEAAGAFLALEALLGLALGAVGLCAGRLADDGGGAGLGLAALGAAIGPLAGVQLLRRAAARRREQLLAELAPTLDLVGIELSAGASPLAALASVTRRGDGPLARELRALLAAAALGGDRGADTRLLEMGERLDLPPLVALATVLATSRDYGSGAAHGIRAIAVDLRRARRRELIATSRRALSRILVPAAVGVLLPFMAVLLFPAVTALSASFR